LELTCAAACASSREPLTAVRASRRFTARGRNVVHLVESVCPARTLRFDVNQRTNKCEQTQRSGRKPNRAYVIWHAASLTTGDLAFVRGLHFVTRPLDAQLRAVAAAVCSSHGSTWAATSYYSCSSRSKFSSTIQLYSEY